MKASAHFTDLIVKGSNPPGFCYRSGLTVYEEGFGNGILASRGWNGAGFPLNILDDFPSYLNAGDFPVCEVFKIEANGVSLLGSWEYVSHTHSTEDGCIHARLTLKSSAVPLTVTLHTYLDGTAVLMRWLTLHNTGSTPLNISHITVMGGGMESIARWADYTDNSEKLYSVGYFERAQWGHEGTFRWHDIGTARMSISSRYDRDRHRHPMFMVKNNALGTIWFGQLGYSGSYAFDFDLNTDNNNGTSHFSFAARLEGDAPTLILEPDECWDSPKMHLGMMNGDLDDIVNEMHRHTRKSVFTLPETAGLSDNGRYGGLIEGGMGPERPMTVEATRHYADTIAAIGGETLIIDAGWYCPNGEESKGWSRQVGDWEYNPEKYPNGIEEIRDYIHSKGLLFGLWGEIERAGVNSRVYSEHPDWFAVDRAGNRTTLLDMSNPEAVQFAENAVIHLVEDYKIDLFRLDYNVDYRIWHHKNKRGESVPARYYDNLYAMFGRLRSRFPDVIFENCASGGSRTDLGLNAYFTHTWVSDHQNQPRGVAITNGMTMVLPPERVDRLASGMGSHAFGTLDAIIRHTLFGRPTTNSYNCAGTEMNPNQIEFVRHSYELYKNHIRPWASEGLIFHHTPECWDLQTKGTLILERAAADASTSVIGIFRLCGDNPDETVVYPRGIDASALYEVTFDNSRASAKLSGFEMINNGLRVRITNNLSSELILIKKLG